MKKTLNKYSVDIPENWEVESSETSDSIYDPNGNGAITVSTYTSNDEESDSVKALKKFVNESTKVKHEKRNGYDISSAEYDDENGRHIFASAIIRDKILVLASYNCLKDSLSISELTKVKEIISTIQTS